MSTIVEQLEKLAATKADLKAALAEKGQTVGDVFSTYPAAVRAIEVSVSPDYVTISAPSSGPGRMFLCYDGLHYTDIVTVPAGSCVFFYDSAIQAGYGISYDFSGDVTEASALMRVNTLSGPIGIAFCPVTSGEIITR